MRRVHQFTTTSFAVLAMAAMAVVATAQQQDPAQPGRQDPDRPQARDAQRDTDRTQRPDARTGNMDQFIVNCLKIDNELEVAVARLATERAENQEVRQFAQQMVQDHTQALENLRQFAGADGRQQGVDQRRDQPGQQQPDARQPGQQPRADQQPDTGQRRDTDAARQAQQAREAQPREGVAQDRRGRAGAGQRGDMLQIKRELADQCLATITAELERKEGIEFDRCFMAHQLFTHLGTWDALQVFGKHASPELQQVLSQGQDKVEQHLQQARQIMKTLDGDAPRTARRPDDQQPQRQQEQEPQQQ